jgi:hypothetical protein
MVKITDRRSLDSVACNEELDTVQSSGQDLEELSEMAALPLIISPTSPAASPSAVNTSFFRNASHFRVDQFTQIQATNVTLNATNTASVPPSVGEGVLTFISNRLTSRRTNF